MDEDVDVFELDPETLEEVFELWNATPQDDLAGLSPHALATLLEDPFEATDVLVVADVLPRAPVAPIVTLLEPLFQALAEGPVRATAAGYLPRRLCVEIEALAFARHGVLAFDPIRPVVTSEARFASLNLARTVCEFAGLLRRRDGAFALTRRGGALYRRSGMAGVYPQLVRAHAQRLEWSSLDGLPPFDLLQVGVGFSLVLLARDGQVERPVEHYAERWLSAFPRSLEAFEAYADSFALDARELYETCFSLRVVERFLEPLGLVTVTRRARPRARPQLLVRTSALFAELIALRLGA